MIIRKARPSRNCEPGEWDASPERRRGFGQAECAGANDEQYARSCPLCRLRRTDF